ncbi:MAG: paraquat-inducible protein A [Pseudomonadota bacterium]
MPAERAIERNLVSCHLCHKLSDASLHTCPRCGEDLHLRKSNSVQRTLALLITASVLYIPANILPIMVTDQFGTATNSTILGGVVLLIDMGSIPIAAIIFIASVMVPLGKLLALFYLCYLASSAKPIGARQSTTMYRITELIGKWSMVDVFVVAILVALVHLTGLLVILPGAAAVAFAGVVMVTIVAAESFDPRIIWDHQESLNE